MADNRCFDPDCELDIEYVCQCSSPETYICEVHLGKHLKFSNRFHNFECIYLSPNEETKHAIIELLAKAKSKKEKIKKKMLNSFSQSIWSSQDSLKESIEKLNIDLRVISNCFENISKTQKISKREQDPLLKLLTLQPDAAIEMIKTMIPINPESHSNLKLFCGLSEEIQRMIECFVKDKFEIYLNRRLLSIENGLEDHGRLANDNLVKLHKSISGLEDENNKNKANFEELNKEIQIKIDIQTKLFNSQLNSAIDDLNKNLNKVDDKFLNVNQSISSLLDENGKSKAKVEDLNKEFQTKIESQAKLFHSLLNSAIDDLNNQLIELKDKLKNVNQSISGLVYENDKNKLAIEELNKEIQNKIENQTKLFNSLLNPVIDDLNRQISEANDKFLIVNKSISGLADDNDKNKAKFDDWNFKNQSLLEEFNKKHNDIYDCLSKVNHTISGLDEENKKTLENIEDLNKEVQLKIQNQADSLNFQLNLAKESFQKKLDKIKNSQSQFNWITAYQLYNLKELKSEDTAIFDNKKYLRTDRDLIKSGALSEIRVLLYI